MELQKKEIKHIAELARLKLSDREIKTYKKQLSDILGYIDQLQEVNTDDVEETAQVTGMENIYREDKKDIWPDDERQAALNEAPELEDDQVKVKKVL